MYRKFLNARSPLRLLEKGLHGGLGPGNLGIVIGGPGVGKASFLVGVALDELLRSGRVLHVSMTQGTAEFSMEFARYLPAPAEVQKELKEKFSSKISDDNE